MMTAHGTSSAAEFLAASEQFVALVEQASVLSAAELLRDAESRLVALYVAALRLPNTNDSDEHEWNPRISHDDWRTVFTTLGHTLGRHDFYREIYDPAAAADPDGAIEGGDQPVEASLADDLADIWRDLKPVVLAWPSAGEGQQSALLWECRSSFESHWGQHLVDALRAIHWWRYVHHLRAAEDSALEV